MMSTPKLALAGALTLLLSAPATHAEFVPDDVLVSDPTKDLPDPEFDVIDNHVVWQDTDDNLWMATLDPETGDMFPTDGRGLLLDVNLRGIGLTGNGPEWAYGDGRPFFAYTRDFQNSHVMAAGFRQPDLSWATSLLGNSFERSRPEGTATSQIGPPRIAYNYLPEGEEIAVGWRNLMDASSEQIVRGPTLEPQGGRWVEGEDRVIVLLRDDRFQFGLIDTTEQDPQIKQATFAGSNKINAYFWHAPEYDEPLFVAMLVRTNQHTIGIFRRSKTDPDVWELFNELLIPSPDYPFVSSPEAFVSNGKSYIVTVAASDLKDDAFKFQPDGPAEIWIAGVDPDEEPFFRRVDDPSIPFPDQPQRSEPEMYITANGPVVFYSELTKGSRGENIRLLRRADTGLGPEWGNDSSSLVGPWASVHRDGRNSGATPYPLADAYEEAGFEAIPNAQSARMVMGPEGNLYISMLRLVPGGVEPEFRGIDTRGGNQEVFTLTNADISPGFVSSNALIGEDGYFVLAGDNQATMFTPEGEHVGSVEVPGVPRALQYAPDGNVVLFSWNGWFQSIDPDSGDTSLQNLTPDRSFGGSSSDCFNTDDRTGCAYIDAPAVDPAKSVIYITYTNGAGDSQIEAWSYDQITKQVSRRWTTAPIQGNVTSPVLSADYTRLYIETESGTLKALNTNTGASIWTAFLGYRNDLPKEPVVNEFGYIMPGGSPDAIETTILRDLGETFEVSFRDRSLVPLSHAAAGRGNRFVLAARRNGAAVLAVINPFHGVIGETPWQAGPAPGRFTGVTVREDGWVFLGGGETTTFKAYRPVWPRF